MSALAGEAAGPTRFVPLFLAVVGLLFVVQGVLTARSLRRFRAHAERVPGVVTALHHRWEGGSGSQGTWWPVLRFRTLDGRDVETRALRGSSPAPAQVGDRVEVLYDPDDPSRASLARGSGSLVVPVAFVVIGLAVAVGLVVRGGLL